MRSRMGTPENIFEPGDMVSGCPCDYCPKIKNCQEWCQAFTLYVRGESARERQENLEQFTKGKPYESR